MSADAAATLYNGRDAVRREVALTWGADGLLIANADEGTHETVPYGELSHRSLAGDSQLLRAGHSGWRLTVVGGLSPDRIARVGRAPQYGTLVDRHGLWRFAAVGAVASALVLAAIVTLPQWLGPMIPPVVEKRLGDAMIGQLGRRTCHTPQSDAALARLAQALDDSAGNPDAMPLDIQIANIPMVNAVALPGGQILVFRGLTDKVDDGDQLAGIVAHEIGHVRERHAMQAILRQFGLAVVLSGASGNFVGSLSQITALGYTRKAERSADAFARARLVAADVSPKPTAAFFRQLRRDQGDSDEEPVWSGYLMSHPGNRERERAFRTAALPGHSYRPALTRAEFQAITRACTDDPRTVKWDLF